MKFQTLFVGVIALFAGTALAAADVGGKWTAKADNQDIAFDFKVDGGKLTGTLENAAAPGAVQIRDGKVEGAKISFHIVRTLNDAETKVLWEGTASDKEIKFTRRAENAAAAGGAPVEVVARRP